MRTHAVFAGLLFAVVASAPGRAAADCDDLIKAAQYGWTERIDRQLAKGVDVNCRDRFGDSPLLAAAATDKVEAARQLLGAGTDPTLRNRRQETAIHRAVGKPPFELLPVLVRAGTDIDAQNKYGQTALLDALGRGHLDAAAKLLDLGADPDIADRTGATAVAKAMRAGVPQGLIDRLLGRSQKIDTQDRSGESPLFDAVRDQDVELVRSLLGAGASPRVRNQAGSPPLSLAGSTEIAALLLEAGASANDGDVRGHTPLIGAAAAGRQERLSLYLASGADPNRRTVIGGTALMSAVRGGHVAIVRQLLAAGADPLSRHDFGVTAWIIAARRGDREMMALLERAGARRETVAHLPEIGTPRSGVYALEPLVDFDVLDGVRFDPATGRLTLFGHRRSESVFASIPYLDYLATALELEEPVPGFSLDTTEASSANVKATWAPENKVWDVSANSLLTGRQRGSAVSPLAAWLLQTVGVPFGSDGNALGASFHSVPSGVRVTHVSPRSAVHAAGLRSGDLVLALDGRDVDSAADLQAGLDTRPSGTLREMTVRRAARTISIRVRPVARRAPETMSAIETFVFALASFGSEEHLAQMRALQRVLASPPGSDARAGAFAELGRTLGITPSEAAALDELALRREILEQLGSVILYQRSWAARYAVQAGRHGGRWGLDWVLERIGHALDRGLENLALQALLEYGSVFPPDDFAWAWMDVWFDARLRFDGVPPDSLLGRSLYEGDVAMKALQPYAHLRYEIPEWEEFVAAHQGRPGGVTRFWIEPGRYRIVRSRDGRSIRFREASTRIGVEEKLPDGRSVPEPRRTRLSEVLTRNYDALGLQVPALHDVAEALKVIAIAQWLREQDFHPRLPQDGRSRWRPPVTVPGIALMSIEFIKGSGLWIRRAAAGGVSVSFRDRRYELGSTADPRAGRAPTLSWTRPVPRSRSQRLMSSIRPPKPLDPTSARGGVNHRPESRTAAAARWMRDQVDGLRDRARVEAEQRLHDLGKSWIVRGTGLSAGAVSRAEKAGTIIREAERDAEWVLDDVSDDEQTLRRSNQAPLRTLGRLQDAGWMPEPRR